MPLLRQTSPPTLHSFGFDVITQIGWWRFGDHRTLDEMATLLAFQHLPISRRQILYLIGDFLALLRAAQPAKIEAQCAWIIEPARLLEPCDKQGQARTTRQVKREVNQFLKRLEQDAAQRPEEAHVIASIVKAVRHR